jgi:hypothetical protein
MTLRINALPFQFGVVGCTSSAALVQQTIGAWPPLSAGVKSASHCRKLYLP